MVKISVIVPVYNSSNYLSKCIDSLINQTLKDIEIIMINDGSTDDSAKIIKKYQKNDNRIKLIDKKNEGQAIARNIGLKESTGEYIAFVDSDDYIDNRLFEITYNTAKKNKNDIVVFDYYITNNKNNIYNKILKDITTGEINNIDFFSAGESPCNKIYKRQFLIENNFSFPEGIIYEDYASIIALIKYNPKINYINEALYFYYQSDESTMRKQEYNKKYEDIFKATEILVSNLKDTKYKEELENMICYHMLYLGSLNFYKYERYDLIDRISNYIRNNFKNWKKNKYVKKYNIKTKIQMFLFYYKKYSIIKLIQKLKRCIK